MGKEFVHEYKTLGLNIAYYRKMHGLTQAALADKINISRTHMSNIEAPNMIVSVSLDVVFSIAKALDIPAYKLLVLPEDIKNQ